MLFMICIYDIYIYIYVYIYIYTFGHAKTTGSKWVNNLFIFYEGTFIDLHYPLFPLLMCFGTTQYNIYIYNRYVRMLFYRMFSHNLYVDIYTYLETQVYRGLSCLNRPIIQPEIRLSCSSRPSLF